MPFPSSHPKTPTRQRGRSEAKTPLTPSALVAGLNSMALASPTRPKKSSKGSIGSITTSKSLSLSRPSSPIKRTTSTSVVVTEELSRQANNGVIRRGGYESRLDVVKFDYEPPARPEIKRSRSQPSIHRERLISGELAALPLDRPDRFIANKSEQDLTASLDLLSLDPQTSSPGHTARLAEAVGIPLNKRILTFHEAPPPSSKDTTLSQQRELVRPLYARPGASGTSTGASTVKTRKIPTQPERVLDAPGMVDDFYLNLLSWSSQNVVAVALAENTYVWKAETGDVVHVGEAPEGTYVSSVDFSNDGMFLGIGMGNGAVELWDIETNAKLRTMTGHQTQVGTLSWNGHILSSGCGDGSIWHHDVRIAHHKVMELLGHSGEVCGLKWSPNGDMLASGGNDNVVNVWDGRVGDVNEGTRVQPKFTKRIHTAAVKAIGWCPWQPALLASGGGTNDATLNVWNTTTGARLHSIKTPAQITSVQWAPHKKEILTTHGYPTNGVMVHSYPKLELVAEIRDAHDSRVLFSAVSPGGEVTVTGAGDENLKFWRIWEGVSVKKKKETLVGKTATLGGVSGILSLR